MEASSKPRKSAEVRREEILVVAIAHFARQGYHGTSTEAVAREAGISQPYLFRLFRTKRELFTACHERACEQVRDVFRRAAGSAPPEERIERMGQAYVDELLPDRNAILMQMQGYVTSEPEIRALARTRWLELVREVSELTGADQQALRDFFASGMLLNVMAALELDPKDL
jgi:AcrR family transcriptional regulator